MKDKDILELINDRIKEKEEEKKRVQNDIQKGIDELNFVLNRIEVKMITESLASGTSNLEEKEHNYFKMEKEKEHNYFKMLDVKERVGNRM